MQRKCDHCGELISEYATTVGTKTYHNECYKDIDLRGNKDKKKDTA